MLRWILTIGVMVLVAGTAFTQCYSRPTYYYSQPYYHQPYYPQKEIVIREVAVPVAVPVLVPAAVFQYLPALQPQVQQAQAAPQLKASDIDRLVRERVDAILRERLGGGGTEPPPLILPGELPRAHERTQRNPAEVTQQAINILGNRCATCHTNPDKVSGDVALFAKKDNVYTFQPNVTKSKIMEEIESKRMPLKKDPIVGDELAILREWALLKE